MSELAGEFISGPCAYCGRESYYEERDETGWEIPCPSDDCPSHCPADCGCHIDGECSNLA